MRFNRLDLARYGKFTDRRIEFPAARRDFHMIVGPNEAGKSTLRQAFFDLLFGFHPRTPLDFLHPKSELRLGAVIGHAGGPLDFQRFKGNKNTLRAADGAPLPDTALDGFLGGATGDFFDKMFGLDHPRLVQGGNDMLKAQDDVGQVLFQAAAGVASLGRVYEALQAEASQLWAPKKSKDRLWYIAQAQLDEANAALKALTVRTREWTELYKHVQDLQDAAHEQRERYGQLMARRAKLERIRRLGPGLAALIGHEKSLLELGPVIELPADAAAILGMSEAEMQAVRDERVAESFHIYKKQLEAQKSGKVAIPPPSKPSTWDTPAELVPESERPLYWSESMDMHLAKLVKACVFDFDAISTTMQQLAEKSALSSSQVHKCPTRLTNEACRLRWAQLDAEQWATVAPNSSALDTEFKVCISAAVLGAGHGSQPSYEALKSLAAGTAPTYLKVPTAFPSVQDTVEGDSDMELD